MGAKTGPQKDELFTEPEVPKAKETEISVLKPAMQIHVQKIRSGWMQEWNETPQTCTQEWTLTAFPVLADGTVALLFESPITAYDRNEKGEIVSRTPENHYRVLVYDPKSGSQVGKYCFKIYGGYAATVFFRHGRLYAAVSGSEKCRYTALQVWPGPDDENQVRLGDDISCLAVTAAGDIIVSYNVGDACGEEAEEMSLISIFRADGSRADMGRIYDEKTGQPTDDFVTDLTLDQQERIWAVLSDGSTALFCGQDGSAAVRNLPVWDVDALAVPGDGSFLYAASRNDAGGYVLFRIPMTENAAGEDETEIRSVRTPEGNMIFCDSVSILKNILAAMIDGVIYVIDLNEQ